MTAFPRKRAGSNLNPQHPIRWLLRCAAAIEKGRPWSGSSGPAVAASPPNRSCRLVRKSASADRIDHTGEVFGDLPQPPLQLHVVGLVTGRHYLRVSPQLADATRSVVLAAVHSGVGRGAQCRQCAPIRTLIERFEDGV